MAGLHLDTPDGRPLIRDLSMELARERIALIGRNGVGKSTLLRVMAGQDQAARGRVVRNGTSLLIPQDLTWRESAAVLHRLVTRAQADPAAGVALQRECRAAGLPSLDRFVAADGDVREARGSRGELRKLYLLDARLQQPDLLLLDEPTLDLDAAGVAWLLGWLQSWPHGLVVVSHARDLLRQFQHFFVIAESGCRYVPGTFAALERDLERENASRQEQYIKNLNHLARREQHHETVLRRRRRKKNVGRLHELARRTPRSRLNEKRSYAQESQAKAARIREDRIRAARTWAHETRRALTVTLPMELLMPTLPADVGRPLIAATGLSATVAGRPLFEDLDVHIARQRVAVTGRNGAGKTTLLQTLLGQRVSDAGIVERDMSRIGSIAQGATDWMLEDSLLDHLLATTDATTPAALAQLLIGHRFPLGLAERPMCSLSPGERVRAALICLSRRSPVVELLVLDEPTYSLDLLGGAALRMALKNWPGGLLVASHDLEFLGSLGMTEHLSLGGDDGQVWRRSLAAGAVIND